MSELRKRTKNGIEGDDDGDDVKKDREESDGANVQVRMNRSVLFVIQTREDLTAAEQPLSKKWRRIILAIALTAVSLFTVSDICLRFAEPSEKRTLALPERWFALLLRSGCQILFGLVWCLLARQKPWGPSLRRIPILIVLVICSALLIVNLDVTSRTLPRSIQITFQSLVPLPTVIFSMSLCLERFHVHRFIGMMCLVLASLLFTQPTFFGGSFIPEPPVLNADTTFSQPVSTSLLQENIFSQCEEQFKIHQSSYCSYDIIGFIHAILAPVVSAYLIIIVFIAQGVHVSTILFWMGLGSFGASIYGVLNTSSFDAMMLDTNAGSLTLTIVSALTGTTATGLFIVSIDKMGPFKALMLRWLEFLLVFVFGNLFGGVNRGFQLCDLSASVLIGIVATHVIIEHLFY